MNDLPPDLEKAVARHLETGIFSTVEEVLRAAMKTLETADLEGLRQSISDENSGRMQPLDKMASKIRQCLGHGQSS